MNIGNAFFRLNFAACFPALTLFRACNNDNPNVIGIIASVLVSFTVTALFNVSLPRFHILSHVDAAAVTDDVSLIAVPAKIPNASPFTVSNPIAFPSNGKKNDEKAIKEELKGSYQKIETPVIHLFIYKPYLLSSTA